MKRHLIVLLGILCLFVSSAPAKNVVVKHVNIRVRTGTHRELVDLVGVLTFDDAAQKISFKVHKGDRLDLYYDDIANVLFEVSTHMRGGPVFELAGSFFAGGIPGRLIAGGHVNDYWMYVAPGLGKGDPWLMEIPKKSSQKVIEKAAAALGDRAVVDVFSERGEDVEKNTLKDRHSKLAVKVDKRNHPLPELKPDQALVVVVCPPQGARFEGLGNQFKLYANGQLIGVNKIGTYSFAYLDPGKYTMVSESENANGFDMKLEAGKDYYFMQNTFQGGWKAQTLLSRHTRELVMYELDGSYYSDWKIKAE